MLMFTAHNFQQKQKPRDVFVLKQCLKFLYLVASLKGMSGFLQQVDYNLLWEKSLSMCVNTGS